MNNNQFKPVISRVYQYLGDKYRCVNSDNRFKLNGQWYDGVLYEREDKNAAMVNLNQIFICTLEDWMANFIPVYIEPKDYIIAESMNNILGIYEVQDTNCGSDIYARSIEGGDKDYLIFEHLEVAPGTCQVAVKNAGSIEHLRENALFFLISEEYKNDILYHRVLSEARFKLQNTVRKFRRLNDLTAINQAQRMLDDFWNSIETKTNETSCQ